ncbi:putative O-methyltransferase [Bisporella sp. PMI_857]|nr:putative O-methyltransferase [Bisporella sp. PMI_857]
MPALPLEVSAILNNISDVVQSLKANKPGARESLISLSHELITVLELPSEAIQRMGWAEPARNAHCRIGVENGMFKYLKESRKQGVSAKGLAENAKVDLPLITRMLKHLSSMHVIKEKAADVLKANTRREFFSSFDVASPSFASFPEYLKVTNYKNPTELTNGPFQFAHKTTLPFFAWLDQNPPYLPIFNNYMSAYRAGGGLGHYLQELCEKHGNLPGYLIFQDREEVIATLTPGTNFKTVAHDFFTPQPVLHARAYYLHSVLHDWGDDDCIKILHNLTSALKKGYSKVLINEIVVSEENASLAATSMDQLMLVLGAMKERTEGQWREILGKAGYRVLTIWNYPGVAESLIEAEVKVEI